MGGFLSKIDASVEKGVNEANNAGTYLGVADAGMKAAGGAGLPGSTALGHIGGALSALGLADNIADMQENGVDANNGLSATANGLNLASWGAATFGTGAVSGTAAPVLAAAGGGMSLGMASNSFMSDLGWLGQNADGTGRSYSDAAADAALWADDAVGGGWLGTAAGLGVGALGAGLGTAATIYSAPFVIGDGLLDGAGAAIDYFWD